MSHENTNPLPINFKFRINDSTRLAARKAQIVKSDLGCLTAGKQRIAEFHLRAPNRGPGDRVHACRIREVLKLVRFFHSQRPKVYLLQPYRIGV